MTDQTGSRMSNLASAVQAELAALEMRARALEEQVTKLDRDLAVCEQDRDSWKDRALAAELRRDRYGFYAVELISRMAGLKELGELQNKMITDLISESKRVASTSTGLPAAQLNLDPASEKKLQDIMNRMGYKPGNGDAADGADTEDDKQVDKKVD